MLRQFWLEVKKIENKNTLSSQCINNISGNENIANLFLNKYNQLYNSVHYDDTEMSTWCDNLKRILRDSKIGCMYNNKYMGIFTYADDIGLLCPTLSGIQYNLTDM